MLENIIYIKELEDDEVSFLKYFKMSRNQFYGILSKITQAN